MANTLTKLKRDAKRAGGLTAKDIVRLARRDVAAARRAAARKKDDVARKARNDRRRAEEAIERGKVGDAARSVADSVANAEIDGEVPEGETDRTVDRARDVAEAGAPVEGVSLRPDGNPREQERLGRGDADVREGTLEALVVGGPQDAESDDLESLLLGEAGDDTEYMMFEGVGLFDDANEDDYDPLVVDTSLVVGDRTQTEEDWWY